jgi:hypothetical protein
MVIYSWFHACLQIYISQQLIVHVNDTEDRGAIYADTQMIYLRYTYLQPCDTVSRARVTIGSARDACTVREETETPTFHWSTGVQCTATCQDIGFQDTADPKSVLSWQPHAWRCKFKHSVTYNSPTYHFFFILADTNILLLYCHFVSLNSYLVICIL